MTSRRNPLTAASLLILMIRVFRGNTLTCDPAEYQIGNKCCPMCPPGNRVRTDCTEFRRTSCLPCLEGTFMNQPTGLKQCYRCTNCDEDHMMCTLVTTFNMCIICSCTGTASKDTVCSGCREGTFSDGTFTSCQPHTQCKSENLQLIKPGTAASDAECGERNSLNVIIIVISAVLLLLVIGFVLVLIWKIRKLLAALIRCGSPPTECTYCIYRFL
ncbi:tumor necrosis factor receptor superfamily member 5-like [Seriola dumerili]|uniref:tumor necrosis factor receptor superfamily member 5-like n=1 Tax=Seriola dumerili TaxID=41447 RepID=UPI000BBE9603|nr:tumor necrosis factor receptor superfamily member 5-like [Seriola dumerili]